VRILLVGGTRFIGWHIASALIGKGDRVCLFHRGVTTGDGLEGVDEIFGDRLRLQSYRSQFQQFNPDVVIDCIGYTTREGRNLIEAFRDKVHRLIFISSCDVYRAHAVLHRATDEPLQETPLREDSPLRTNAFPYRTLATGADDWKYDYDKIPVERMLLDESGFQTTVFRLPAVYGPRDYQHRVEEYLNKMRAEQTPIVLGESLSKWRWSRGYVGNIAAAIVHSLSYPPSEPTVFNLADPVAFSEQDWVRQIARAAGWTGKILVVPDEELLMELKQPYNFAQDCTIDAGRFRATTGFSEPFSIEESLCRTLAELAGSLFGTTGS
jgi:nucleoside-diphosphate-sugar epimerase